MMCKKKCWLLFLLVLPWAVLPQDFGAIFGGLNRLDILMNEQQSLIDSMTGDNENLKGIIESLQTLSATQGQLLNEQQTTWQEQQRIAERQAQLLRTYIRRTRTLTVSLLVAAPAAALAGWIVGRVIK
jgi:hypothetical protein